MLPPSSLQPLPIAKFIIVFWGLLPHGDEYYRATQETWVGSLLGGWVSVPSSHSVWESQTLSLDSEPVFSQPFHRHLASVTPEETGSFLLLPAGLMTSSLLSGGLDPQRHFFFLSLFLIWLHLIRVFFFLFLFILFSSFCP